MSDEPSGELTLAEVLAAAAEDLADVVDGDDGGLRTWSSGGRPFATLAHGRAEFRLGPVVAGAAARTPDAGPSARGADWVAFAPAELDDPAIDRAEAWFLSARRRAVAPQP